MKASVVVPAYNEEEYIAECLKSLLNQTDNPDGIIVVDNNSTDNTVKIIKQFPEIVLLHEKHLRKSEWEKIKNELCTDDKTVEKIISIF